MNNAYAMPFPPAVPPDWREDASCRDADPELFFPEGTSGPALLQADQAKRVCQSCPVRQPCLSFALRLGLPPGIWGGASEAERRELHRSASRNAVARR